MKLLLTLTVFVLSSLAYSSNLETRDNIAEFMSSNVINRPLETIQWNPIFKTSEGRWHQTQWERQTEYKNLKKTTVGISFEYSVKVEFREYRLDEEGKPYGQPVRVTNYDSTQAIEVNQLGMQNSLYGYFRTVKSMAGDKVNDTSGQFRKVRIYLSQENNPGNNDEDFSTQVLHIDLENVFPKNTYNADRGVHSLVFSDFYQMLWIKEGKLFRSEWFQNYDVDTTTLEKLRPKTGGKVYYDNE